MLVHEAVATLAPRDAEVLELQLRSELTPAEIGDVLGLNRNAANQLCHRVRGRFATAFRARMLWHGGRPTCAALGTELTAAGITAFGSAAVPIADRHAETCNACGERRRTLVQPGALFAAIPLLPAPALLKARVAAHLAGHGVPMSGSGASAGSVGATLGGSASGGSASGPGSGPKSRSGSTGSGSTHGSAAGPTRRATVATGVLAVVLMVVAVLVAQRSDRDKDLHVTANGTAPSSTLAGQSPSVSPSPSGSGPSGADPASGTVIEPGTVVAPVTDAGSTTGDPLVPGGTATTTTLAPTTSTMVVPATIDVLALDPATTQASPYNIGPTSPILRWKVRNAQQVQVWLLSNTGTGLSRTRVLSTSPDGELAVCPGTVDGTKCQALTGTYAFEIEMVGLDGLTMRTDPSARPSFDVVPVIY